MRNKQGRTCEYSRREHACRTFVKGSTSSSSSKLTICCVTARADSFLFFCVLKKDFPRSTVVVINITHHQRERGRERLFERETEHLWLRQPMHGIGRDPFRRA